MIRALAGDCLELLPTLAEASIDACVTDPPYHLTKGGAIDLNSPAGRSRGFMGRAWDGGDIAFRPEVWREVLRVLKPGGHLVAFGGSRTYHRLACAIEDAGFEIRDQIMWIYSQGFPKSHDVSKAIDKTAGTDGSYGDRKANIHSRGDHVLHEGWKRPWMDDPDAVDKSGRAYHPATPAAREWQGWGTALKPAHEPIVLARRPLIGTVAANVLAHGTGAINVDGCRVTASLDDIDRAHVPQPKMRPNGIDSGHALGASEGRNGETFDLSSGRWPANLIHDGSEEVVGAFPDASPGTGGQYGGTDPGMWACKKRKEIYRHNDVAGSAARFYYTAKADKGDRLSSRHPTVKPVDLMAYLCRLVCPPGGLVLDPFAGSGATGMACMREGFDAILIEREAEYVADIKRRIAHVSGEDAPLFAEKPMPPKQETWFEMWSRPYEAPQ